ncbi:MAG: NUDIX hydrolase [Bacteroidetes bacterium]|nr:NUDIX hydrolase [Bacteroidota bacterium]
MPEATVAIMAMKFFVLDMKMLLIKRSRDPFKEYWCLPGGHIEKNEKITDAIARELKEETGLDLVRGDLEFVTAADEIYPDKNVHNVVLGFISIVIGEVKLNSEALEYKWCPLEEILGTELAFGQQKIVKAYEDQKSALEIQRR